VLRFPPLAAGLGLLSWIALLTWNLSPYGRFLNHGDWASPSLGAICAVAPGGSWVVPALLYGGGWLLMSAAMMLPTARPLIRLFDRMTAGRTNHATLHSLLIAGYMLAWSAFGLLAHLLDGGVHAAFANWLWLATHPWVAGAGVLALAGSFQFSSLKYHCLDKCRAPLGFIMTYWRGARARREAFVLGLAHGIYCVGCCWALMLLMFVVGTGNFGLMLLLGLIMGFEKNHRWGRHLPAPLGGALLAMAGLVVLRSLV
jgi:predicted metal-binding membrane protein